MRSVPGWRPILTPSSVTGIRDSGVPVALEMEMRLSSGWVTRALRPNGMGARWGRKPDKASFGVKGAEALQTELFKVSPTLWSKSKDSSGGRW